VTTSKPSPPLSRSQRRQREQVASQLKAYIAQHGMEAFLRRVFQGDSSAYTYDEQENLWIVPDTRHKGPGKEYFCVRPNGEWFKAHMPDTCTQ
jgi:hypothetical protein